MTAHAAVPITADDERIAVERRVPQICAARVLRELHRHEEYSTALDIALAKCDARLIGQIFLAVRGHLAARDALVELHRTEPEMPPPSAVTAAVFLAAT